MTNHLERNELSTNMAGKEDAVNDSDGILDAAITAEIEIVWSGAQSEKVLSSAQMQQNVAIRMTGSTSNPSPVLKLANVQRGQLIVINELATDVDITDFNENDTLTVVSGQTISLYATPDGVEEIVASAVVGGTLDTLSDGPGSYAAQGGRLVAIKGDASGFEYVSVLELQFRYLKQPCRVATTAAITISTALNNGDTIDGVTLATGDRVLVKNQASPVDNGIYVVGVSPARATDMDADNETYGGTIVAVEEGTANADTAWLLTSNGEVDVGTDPINFSNFSVSPSAINSNSYANLTAGYTSTAYNNGTQSGGTLTPDPANGNLQRAVNGGAHSFACPSVGTGDSLTMIVQYTNNGSAGAITPTGFTVTDVADLTTTNGDDFFFHIVVINGFSSLTVQALQ